MEKIRIEATKNTRRLGVKMAVNLVKSKKYRATTKGIRVRTLVRIPRVELLNYEITLGAG